MVTSMQGARDPGRAQDNPGVGKMGDPTHTKFYKYLPSKRTQIQLLSISSLTAGHMHAFQVNIPCVGKSFSKGTQSVSPENSEEPQVARGPQACAGGGDRGQDRAWPAGVLRRTGWGQRGPG